MTTVAQVIQELTEHVERIQTNGVFDNEEYIRKVKSLLPPLINNSLNAECGKYIRLCFLPIIRLALDF